MRRILVALMMVMIGGSAAAGDFTPTPPKPVGFSVRDRDGVVHEGAEFRARLTLLHFWASWCLPCREELPALARLQSDMAKDGVRVVAVSVDRLGWNAIDRTIKELDVGGLDIFLDLNREAAIGLGVEGLPSTVVIDGQGREIARLNGPGDWADQAVREQLVQLQRESVGLER